MGLLPFLQSPGLEFNLLVLVRLTSKGIDHYRRLTDTLLEVGIRRCITGIFLKPLLRSLRESPGPPLCSLAEVYGYQG
jgi:hypothetical protein